MIINYMYWEDAIQNKKDLSQTTDELMGTFNTCRPLVIRLVNAYSFTATRGPL